MEEQVNLAIFALLTVVREVLIPLKIPLIVFLGVVLVVGQQQKTHLALTIMPVLVVQMVETAEALTIHIQMEAEIGLNKEELGKEALLVNSERLELICTPAVVAVVC